jgi:phosphate transport system substrate-binding protein
MNRRTALRLLAALFCCCTASCSADDDISLQGAGATFPAPLYQRWVLEYYKAHPDVRVNYQAIGSGAGQRRFSDELVSFGASDEYMDAKKAEKIKRGVLQIPMTAGSIAICYNVPGAGPGLRLSRKAYVGIFTGDVNRWNDPLIAENNPGVALPDLEITVIRRAEGSGTTAVFTGHLSKVDPEFQKRVGKGKTVNWPKDFLGGKGNAGVAALVEQTPGAVGYLEYGYAILAKLNMSALQNHAGLHATAEKKAGIFVLPGKDSGQAALSSAKFQPDFHIVEADPKGADAYPIATYTWLLCFKRYDDPKVSATLKDVLRYCLTDGQKINEQLGYLPLPEEVRSAALKAVDTITP